MKALKAKSFELRQVVLDMICNAKAGHIGGDFSVQDILTVKPFQRPTRCCNASHNFKSV